MSFQLKTRGHKATRGYLSDLISHTDQDLQDALVLLGKSVVDEARHNLQNNTNIDSGTLLASIGIIEQGRNYIIFGTNLPYAGYIEYGRGEIRPVNGEWLHWIDKQTGEDVFAKFAKATEPMPFLEPAVIIHQEKFQDVVTEQITKRKVPVIGDDQ